MALTAIQFRYEKFLDDIYIIIFFRLDTFMPQFIFAIQYLQEFLTLILYWIIL